MGIALKDSGLSLVDWQERWKQGLTFWNKPQVNPVLQCYFAQLQLRPGDGVFVPLCGSSVDVLWLKSQGVQVIACEISRLAIEQLFSQANLSATVTQDGAMLCWQADGLTVYEGDYFLLKPTQLKAVKAVYDRAALIALPKEGERGRKAYVRKMRQLLSVGVKTLLVSLDYDEKELTGPPYPVNYEEVVWQYAFDHIIEFLQVDAVLDNEPHLRQRGLSSLQEWVYLMTRYTPVYADFSKPPNDF